MNAKWWIALRTTSYYVLLPVVLLARLLFYLLYLVATPFISVARVTGHILMFPVRLFTRFITTFEALLIFLTCAVFLGALSGVIVHAILRGFAFYFKLDQKPVPKTIPARGHDAASYRAAREEKKRVEEEARHRQEEKEERLKTRARLLASQPLIREVVREAKRTPIVGPTSSPISPNTSTSATRSGLFNQTILEHTDEEDDSVF